MTRLSISDHVDHVSVIQSRRRQLRGQRRSLLLVGLWRTLALTGLLASLLWLITLPVWLLQRPEQIEIRGNRWLLSSAIQTLLPLRYPQSLLQLQPQSLAAALGQRGPISQTTVFRQLLPPKLVVEVQERPPVALTRCDNCTLQEHLLKEHLSVSALVPQRDSTWLMDATGMVAPLKSYGGLRRPADAPQLQVLGFLQPPQQVSASVNSPPGNSTSVNSTAKPIANLVAIDPLKRSQWQKIYPLIQRSAIKISLLDWRVNSNLILKTELGTVHLGPYSSRFSEQIQALDQMRNLQSYRQAGPIAYIDLADPKRPLLQLQPGSNSKTSTSP